jgi:hypothetical protein
MSNLVVVSKRRARKRNFLNVFGSRKCLWVQIGGKSHGFISSVTIEYTASQEFKHHLKSGLATPLLVGRTKLTSCDRQRICQLAIFPSAGLSYSRRWVASQDFRVIKYAKKS